MPLSDKTLSLLQSGGMPSASPTTALSSKTLSLLGSAPEENEDGIWSTIAPFTSRIGGAIAGGLAGGAVGSAFPVVGTALGAGVGAFLGGAGGEAGAQVLEGRELDPTEIALGGAFSAIPAGPVGRAVAQPGLTFLKRAGLHALEGASQGALEATVRPAASALLRGETEDIRLPTFGEFAGGVLGGAAIGGALGGGFDYLSTGGRANPTEQENLNAVLMRRMAAEEQQAPATWQGDAPVEFAQEPLQPVRGPGEVAADQMAVEGYPNIWDDNDPFTALPPVWQGEPPPEFMPPAVEPPVPPPPPPTATPAEFAPVDLPIVRTPAEVAADKLKLAGVPEVWNDGQATPIDPTVVEPPLVVEEMLTPQNFIEETPRPEIPRSDLVVEEILPEQNFIEETPRPDYTAPLPDEEPVPVPKRRAGERDPVARYAELVKEFNLDPDNPQTRPLVERLVAEEDAHAALKSDANTDPKTGVPNGRALRTAADSKEHGAWTYGDMAGLKDVNDSHGHDAGDAYIKEIFRIANEEAVQRGGKLFRPHESGDEMVFGARDEAHARELGHAVKDRLKKSVIEITLDGKVIDRYQGARLDFGYAKGQDANAIREADAYLKAYRKRAEQLPVDHPEYRKVNERSKSGNLRSVHEAPAEGNLDPDSRTAPPAELAPQTPVEATPGVPETGTTVPKSGKLFDRTAALDRLKSRGRKLNDLGSAAAEGAGAMRDAAEVGASYVEDFARSTGGKVPGFADFARTVGNALANVIPNISKFIRKIYDDAVSLFTGRAKTPVEAPPVERTAGAATGSKAAQAEAEAARSAPPPPPPPDGPPPPPPGSGEPMGKRNPPDAPPRVETKVDDLAALKDENPDLKVPPLSRDTARPWESLDPEIRKKVEDINGDEKKEVALYERARSGKINDVEVQVLDSLVKRKSNDYEVALTKLREAEASGKPGTESVEYLRASMDKLVADLAVAARSDIEAGTKLARALAARGRVMAPAAGDTPEHILRHLFKQIPDLSPKAAAQLVDIIKTRPQDMQDALHVALQPGKADKILEIWKAGLVSGVPTQVANFMGNFGEQIVRVGETLVASQLDKFGGPKTRFSGEAKFELNGGFRGMAKGFGELKKELKDIATLAPERIDLSEPFERQVGAVGGKTGRFVRTPFRLLAAFDRFFQAYGGEAELYKLAFREAKGDVKKAQEIIANPSSEMLDAVKTSKRSRTFQDPNALANAIMNLRSQNKLLHFVAPFIQTPANILSATLDRSPMGFYEAGKAYKAYRTAVKKGDAEEIAKLKGVAVDKLARPLLGTLLMGGFAAYAKAGGMTGSGPTDAKDKNELRNSGWQAYSFVIPGPDGKKTYIPFNRFEPVSGLLGFAADMAEAGDSKSGNDLLAKGVGSVVSNLTSKTYLQGLADAAELINDPMGAGSKYVTDLAASAVPNIVGKAAQAIDPVVRDTRPESTGLAGIPEEIKKKVQARIPGLSSSLPARRSGTGETIERRGNAASRFASPVQPSMEEDGMAYSQLLVDLDAVPSAPQKLIKMRGRPVRLNDAEYKLIQEADEKTTLKLQKLTAQLAFTRLNEEQKRNVLRNNYERGRADARNKVLKTPEFRKRASEALKK